MSKKSIVIDILVEACFLTENKAVSIPLGEYSKLPWLAEDGDKAFDINFEKAYLGEEILAPPFQNQNKILEKGVHLHWIIPSFYGKEYDNKLNAAPNRWLVQKNNSEEKWIVVSDYVHHPKMNIKKTENHNEVEFEISNKYAIYPINLNNLKKGEPPFCYLGKSFPIQEYNSNPTRKEDILNNSFEKIFNQKLTVLGFGSVNFSSNYSNCKSVFGFHDPLGNIDDSYTIYGWHSNKEDDLIKNNIDDRQLKELLKVDDLIKNNIDDGQLKDFLNEKFEISYDGNEELSKTEWRKTLFLGTAKIGFKTETPTSKAKVTVANTASEAFSALLSKELSDEKHIEKIKTEDKLEFFLMNSKMNGLLTDHVHKFIEERHKKGFAMHKGGEIYSFKDHYIGAIEGFKGYPLEQELYTKLNELNTLKHNLNEDNNNLKSLKTQTYADWYKYMRAAYPPIGSLDLFPDRDELERLIKISTLEEIKKINKTIKDNNDKLNKKIAAINNSFKAFLDVCLEKIKNIITSYQSKNDANSKNLLEQSLKIKLNIQEVYEDFPSTYNYSPLKIIPEKPFWEATEPLLAIDGFKKGNRKIDINASVQENIWCDNILQYDKVKVSAPNELTKEDWFPFYMEWEIGIENSPVDLSGLTAKEWEDTFFENYFLDDDSPGIYTSISKDIIKKRLTDNDAVYRGGTILNPYMGDAYKNSLEKYIDFCNQKLEQLSSDKDENIIAYWNKNKELASSALHTLENKNILCQRLSGFNAACLMLRKVTQLKITEPLGFKNSIKFSDDISEICNKEEQLSPSTLNDFLPIRNGEIKIKKLRFIDNFGIYKDIVPSALITSDTLTSLELRKTDDIKSYNEEAINQLANEVFLPPRIVQPARLNFNFLEGNLERMTENPNTTPVCGWFVPNYLNENIMVFNNNGEALGTLEKDILGLVSLPWHKNIPATDAHLNKVINKITALSNQKNNLIDSFLSTLQDGLNSIATADYSMHNSKAMLFGRPIAIVRVKAELQIKGYPALDQSWKATLIDIQKIKALNENETYLAQKSRFTGDWKNIKLPFRLGEYKQLNDGLLGYWIETKDANENISLDDVFYAPQTKIDNSDKIKSFTEGKRSNKDNDFIHHLSPDGKALHFTALIDPKGSLHGTTGILPTEELSIPTQLWQPALEKMTMWFKTGPILHFEKANIQKDAISNPSEKLAQRAINLPKIADYEWRWFEKENENEEGKFAEVSNPEFTKIYSELPEIKKGYLLLEKQSKKINNH